MTECLMFSGTRKENARENFNKWAKGKRLKDMVIHEQLFRNRDSTEEVGVIIIVYRDSDEERLSKKGSVGEKKR